MSLQGMPQMLQALQFYRQALSMLHGVHVSVAKFNLRAWASNRQLLMATAQQDGTADGNRLTNILGVQWNTTTDKIYPLL